MMLKYLLEKEFKYFFRNKFLPKLVIIFPVMVMLVIPWITTMEIKDIRVIVVDQDRSLASEQLIRDIDASMYFLLDEVTDRYDNALRKIEYGTADAIVEIPPYFEKDLITKGLSPVQLSVNTVNGTKGALGGGYLGIIMANFSQQFLSKNRPTPVIVNLSTPVIARNEAIQPPSVIVNLSTPVIARNEAIQLQPPSTTLATTELPITSETNHSPLKILTQYRYNPLLDYKTYMIPALMVILLIVMCGFLPTLNIVGEKERGTIEQMNVTPVSKFNFIFAKLIPYWIMGILILTICMAVAYFVYGLYPKGSIWIIYLYAIMFVLAISGFGLVVSNYSNTMQQAMFVMFFFVMIFQLMSGLLTPIRSMPEWAQWITVFNPPRYFVQMIRLIYLKGCSFSDLYTEFFALLAFVLFFGLWAVLSYRKRE